MTAAFVCQTTDACSNNLHFIPTSETTHEVKLNICIKPEYFWHIYFASDVSKSVLGQNHIPPCLRVATFFFITNIKSSPLCTFAWPRTAYLDRKWLSDRHAKGPISKRNSFENLLKTRIGTWFWSPDRPNWWILHSASQSQCNVPCVLQLKPSFRALCNEGPCGCANLSVTMSVVSQRSSLGWV